MVYVSFYTYANMAAQVVGDVQKVPTAQPHPWFCKEIFLPRDLQWAGYIGDFSIQKQALVFGINLEFTEAWKRVYPKIKENLSLFSGLLGEHQGLEWHWMGRPSSLGMQRSTNMLLLP